MAPRGHGSIVSNEEIESATSAGLIGGLHGAATWGAACLAAGIAAQFFSPVYRKLTVQFKVYLQLSGMTVGSMIEAERRFRDAEKRNRVFRKMARDRAVWSAYEDGFGGGGAGGGAAESGAGGPAAERRADGSGVVRSGSGGGGGGGGGG